MNLVYPDLDVGALLAGAARRYGAREALRDGTEALSYAELYARSVRFAAELRGRGVAAGEVLALHLPNGVWFPIAYFGTLLAGAVAALTNPLQPPGALRRQLADAGAVAAVTHPVHAAALAEAAVPLRFVIEVPVPLAAGPTEPLPSVAPDSLAHLAYTGGTTGAPKAVEVSHRNVVANLMQLANWRAGAVPDGTDGLRPGPGAEDYPLGLGRDAAVLVPPLYHAHALIHLGFMLVCGMSVAILGRFDADRLLDAVERHRAAYLTGSPALWHALLAAGGGGRDVSSVTCVVSGSAPLDPPARHGLAGLFPGAVILEGYGLTEATCTTHSNPAARGAQRKPGSVGLPLADTAVEVRGPDGRVLGRAETGEIWVRGPQVTRGYRNRAQETAAQFVDGWLDTGDLGHLDADGFLFVTGRAKDMLIYKGYNVYPRELEELLLGCPGVAEAAVVGRPVPGVGELPVAFVVPDGRAPVTEDALVRYVGERVAPYKRLREAHLVDRLPTSQLGKVLKHELRRRLQA